VLIYDKNNYSLINTQSHMCLYDDNVGSIIFDSNETMIYVCTTGRHFFKIYKNGTKLSYSNFFLTSSFIDS